MAGLFEDANRAVVEAAFINVEWASVPATSAPPSTAGDGLNLRGSTRGIVIAQDAGDVTVWAYFAAAALWIPLSDAGRSGVGATGDSWKLNTGGADRIYIQSTTTLPVLYGRSYV